MYYEVSDSALAPELKPKVLTLTPGTLCIINNARVLPIRKQIFPLFA